MIGKQIHNYHIMKLLGEGGMAFVFLAENQVLGNKVAIKILKDDFVRNQNIRKRFIAEGRNLVNMSHPNIVKVVDLIDAGDIVALVMEYIEGMTLSEYITQHGKLSDDEIKTLFGEMLEAVKYIHSKGIIHRDIKPSNFMISKDKKLKLLDFGIAKNTNDSGNEYTATSLNQQMGTPIYMSPEQVRGQLITERTDIYSLGVVLWYLVMGKPIYNSSEISFFDLQLKIVQEDLPLTDTRWDTIIQKATQKEESKRFQSAEEYLLNLMKKNASKNNFERTVFEEKTALPKKENSIPPDSNADKLKKRKKIIYLSLIMIFLSLVCVILFINRNENKKVIKKEDKHILNTQDTELSKNEHDFDTAVINNESTSLENEMPKEPNLNEVNSETSFWGITKVVSVERTKKYTIVKFKYQTLQTNSWISINSNTYIVDKQNNKRLYIKDSYGIPFSPSKRHAKYAYQTIEFELFFPVVSENCKTIDFLESDESDWKFYNLKVVKVDKSESEISAKIARGKVEQEEREEEYEREKEKQERDDELKRKEEEEKKYKKIKFSNNSNVSTINLAIIYYDGETWVTKGWYRVSSGGSFTFDLPYNYSASSFYYYASGGGYTWTSGGEKYCIDPENAFSYYDNKAHACTKTESFLKKSIQGTISYINLGN